MDYSNLHHIPDLRENWLTIAQHVDEDVQRLKKGLYDAIEEKNINLKPLAAEKKRLANKAYALNEKAKEICQKITDNLRKDVETCLQDITIGATQLDENQIALNALNRVLAIYSYKEISCASLENKSFYDSWTAVCNALSLIETNQDLKYLTAFKQICSEVETVQKKIKTTMATAWAECVTIDEVRKQKETVISVVVDKNQSNTMREIIQTVHQMSDKSLIDKFIESVRFKILLPQISSESDVKSEQTGGIARLIISIDKSSSAPHYLKVFDRIALALDFIYTHINVDIPNNGDLLMVMGQTMAEEVTEKLMENCLSQVILSQPGHTETLGDVVVNAEKMEATLKQMGFLSNDISLMDTDGANLFFTNMIYGLYLEKARNMMKKQTLVSSQLELKSVGPDGFRQSCFEQDRDFLDKCPKELNVNSYCKDILELVDSIVKEVNTTGKNTHGLRHLYTICNIFEMFCAIVPLHWKKLFESSPYQVAIFHNSCLYFAHMLLCLASECKNDWPANLSDEFSRLIDQSRELRFLAKSTLKNCISKKQIEIVANLKESGLATIENHAKLDATAESTVRQSIRLLENFSMSVKSLPDRVYINTMGFLIDSFTETLVALVCKANDISAVSASELLSIFGVVSDRLSKMFKDPLEIVRWCRKWLRFEEMKLILGANMETFRDRWASGFGPISYSFSKEEASHLLRALFSNTSARSALLLEISKYKD